MGSQQRARAHFIVGLQIYTSSQKPKSALTDWK